MRRLLWVLIILSILFTTCAFGHGQIGKVYIVWQKLLGGSHDDAGVSVQQTRDGGYIIAGWTESSGGNITKNHGLSDAWIVKLDGDGNIEWQKTLGGSSIDGAYSVHQTEDGGYIVAGITASSDGDVSGENHGQVDAWIVKLDSKGNIQWQKVLGGSSIDEADFVLETKDGGYIFVGWSDSNDGDVHDNHGGADLWVVKLGVKE